MVWTFLLFLYKARLNKKKRQQLFLSQYVFHPSFRLKLSPYYPELSDQDWLKVEDAMRQYFRIHFHTPGKNIGMPSRIVDNYWHEFILHTRSYSHFCQEAFGRFIHHTPANMMVKKNESKALRRTWRGACKDENLSPQQVAVRPLLFAIDADLKIPHGFVHNPSLLADSTDSSPFEIEISCSSCGGGD